MEEGDYSFRSTGSRNVHSNASGYRLETSRSHAWAILSRMGDWHLMMHVPEAISFRYEGFRLTKQAVVHGDYENAFRVQGIS